jgi:hypothetical protein
VDAFAGLLLLLLLPAHAAAIHARNRTVCLAGVHQSMGSTIVRHITLSPTKLKQPGALRGRSRLQAGEHTIKIHAVMTSSISKLDRLSHPTGINLLLHHE